MTIKNRLLAGLLGLLLVQGAYAAQFGNIHNLKVNGLAYTPGMLLPNLGKDASGNFIVTLEYGHNWNSLNTFALGTEVCTGKTTTAKPTVAVLDDTSRCFAGYKEVQTLGGLSTAPDADSLAVVRQTIGLNQATVSATFVLSHQTPLITSVNGSNNITYSGITYNDPGQVQNIFTFGGIANQITQVVKETITPTVTGTLKNRALSVKLVPRSSDFDSTGNVYVAALLPKGVGGVALDTLFLKSATGWSLYNPSQPLPAWKTGVTLGYLDYSNLLDGTINLRGLDGAQLIVGYGQNEADVLANQKYQVVHTLVTTEADTAEIAAEAATLNANTALLAQITKNGMELLVPFNSYTTYKVSVSDSLNLGQFSLCGTKICWKFTTWPYSTTQKYLTLGAVYAYDESTKFWNILN